MEKRIKHKDNKDSCADKQCPIHGHLKLRGRRFKGYVIKKLPRRVAIEFERIVHVRKYERQMKKKTKIHARLPDCMKNQIEEGDYIEVRECRPLSKIVHFCVVKKIRGGENFELSGAEDSAETQNSRKEK